MLSDFLLNAELREELPLTSMHLKNNSLVHPWAKQFPLSIKGENQTQEEDI